MQKGCSGKVVVPLLGGWITLFALYMLFSASWQAAELVAAGIAGGLVAAFQAALRRYSADQPGLTLSALRPLGPALGEMARDTFRLSGALLAATVFALPSGRFRIIPAPSGTVPDSGAGRAIAIAAASLAPNAFVVAAGTDPSRFVAHQLLAETEGADR